MQRWVRWEKFNVFYLHNTKNLSTLKLQIIREITNGNFRNCTLATFMGNSVVNGCKWPSRFRFLSMRKARWIPPLKYLEKLKQFRGLCKNRILQVRFITFQTLFSKEILTMPSSIAYDGKRFATKLDRYINTIVFKDERRCKCIMRTNSVFQGLPYIWNTFKYFNTFTPGALRKFLQNCGKRSSLYKAHTELIKAKKSAKKMKETAYHFSKASCDLTPLASRPSLQSMWN